jgi:lipoate-protein ligase A
MGPARLATVFDGARPPAWNMALDEALLRHATGAWLRLYAWSTPAISLGYFQAAQTVEGDLPRVRRVTGGGAIVHADEITLALALPSTLLPARVADAYALVNGAVAAVLAAHGVRASPPATAGGHASGWCFARATGLDLVLADGRKVFGSAQRRTGGRTLHHGSLVLRAPPLTPFCGDLPELAARRTELETELASALAMAIGARIDRVETWPAEVSAAAAKLLSERHARSAWIERA